MTSEVNAIIAEMQADGTMDAICDTWFSGDVTGLHLPDLDFSTATKGTLTLGLANTSPPMAYVGAGGEVLGSDVAMMTEIAYRMGYKLELVPMDFSSLIPGLASGKLDMAVGGISITDERKKSVDLTDTYLEGGVVALVRDLNAVEKEVSFLDGLKASFVKSFITENRYELILEGIGVTLIITICSALLGSILGFLICLLRRSKRKPLSMLGKLYIGLVQGTPTMVLLMLLYFVVFADSSLDAVVVAIFGFALSFSAYVSEMMRTGIDAVDGGQIEAAQAIGFTKMQTFWKITFPQAARHFLPVYRGEFISMMKMTSVVGYITIQDLTKMSDIIRSRTYEAFFPLIVTALIYLVLSYFLIAILSYLERKIDPKRRKRIVKGVTAQ